MPADIKQTLESLLLLVSHVGGLKSAGFGEVVTRSLVESADASPVKPAQQMDDVVLDLSFDGPLLVDTYRQALNVLVGSSVVPGSALKGALANALADAGLLATQAEKDALSRIRISHAFPLDAAGALSDRSIPSALACVANKTTEARQGRLCFTGDDLGPLCAISAPVFPGDWKDKDFEWAREALGRPSANLLRQARGRVGIKPNGTAEKGQLFVTELVEIEDRRWRVRLSRNGADPQVFGQIVAFFESGFAGVGRTGARVTGTRKGAPKAVPVAPGQGRMVLMLETPGVLTDPLSSLPVDQQYLAYFRMLLGQGVGGVVAVASRRMAGDYQAHRHSAKPGQYLPFEVTEAGATFALQLDADAATKLQAYLDTGLPPLIGGRLLTDAVTGWPICPFMPENGFGEVSLLDERAINAAVAAGKEAA